MSQTLYNYSRTLMLENFIIAEYVINNLNNKS